MEFDWHLIPDPCPLATWRCATRRTQQSYVDFFKQQGVRVVNMSWGGSVEGIEPRSSSAASARRRRAQGDRARLLRHPERRTHHGLRERARDPVRDLGGKQQRGRLVRRGHPGGIVLPNLLTVGAVDKAGDEASFTSYGPTVKVHANGYQVESMIPGRRARRVRVRPWRRRRS